MISVKPALAQDIRYFTRSFQTMVPEKTENERKYIYEEDVVSVEDRTNGLLKLKVSVYGLVDLTQLNEFIWYGYGQAIDLNYKNYFQNAVGIFYFFDEDGNPETQYIIKNRRCTFSQVWDGNKNPILMNGTGNHINFSLEQNEEIVTVYNDSVKVLSYGIRMDKKDTIYYTHDKMALPKEGIQAFYAKLVKKLRYPIGAQLSRKEARIYIQFIVDESGKLTDFKSLSSEGYRFEEKTLKKLEEFPNWNPATYHGRIVKSKYVLPVTFKLN